MEVGQQCCLGKGLDLDVQMSFLNSESKLVVLDESDSKSGAFRLVTFYAIMGARQPDFKRLEVYLETSHS